MRWFFSNLLASVLKLFFKFLGIDIFCYEPKAGEKQQQSNSKLVSRGNSGTKIPNHPERD